MTWHEVYGIIDDANALVCTAQRRYEEGTPEWTELARAHNLLLAILIEGKLS